MNEAQTSSSNINLEILNSLVAGHQLYGGDLISTLQFRKNDIEELFEEATWLLENNEPLPSYVLEMLPHDVECYELLTGGQLPIKLIGLLSTHGYYELVIETFCKLKKGKTQHS
ncbi:hypothetical protein GCM10009104_25660 [Marinobacterium maritimum]|uniref:Uncharacterized protein n=1 Tax=Marinobacterium maritimum TaxID=500162 RepID=A0ABN1I898_9GAMM